MASANPSMTSNPLPTSLYESLLLKLVTVLELTQQSEGAVTPQAKQALLQAVRSMYALTFAGSHPPSDQRLQNRHQSSQGTCNESTRR